MTVASQEANLLSELLQTLDGDPLGTLAATFLTKAETLIADPWAMSAIPDFIYPDTIGERPPDLEDRLTFQRALGRSAVRDAEIYELLLEIRHVLKPLTLLDDPSIVKRVKEELADASPGVGLINTGDAENISVVLRSADESANTGFVLTPPPQRSHNLGVDYHRRYY